MLSSIRIHFSLRCRSSILPSGRNTFLFWGSVPMTASLILLKRCLQGASLLGDEWISGPLPCVFLIILFSVHPSQPCSGFSLWLHFSSLLLFCYDWLLFFSFLLPCICLLFLLVLWIRKKPCSSVVSCISSSLLLLCLHSSEVSLFTYCSAPSVLFFSRSLQILSSWHSFLSLLQMPIWNLPLPLLAFFLDLFF